jgi:hypothetical protein
MEVDPLYCDIIIQRWQNFAGRQGTRQGTANNPEQAA